MTAVITAREEATPGRTRISGKALTSLATAIAATALGVPSGRVHATITDSSGLLGVHVRAPVTMPPVTSEPRRRIGTAVEAGTVLERLEQARSRISEEMGALSGRRVGRVVIEVTGVASVAEGRVS